MKFLIHRDILNMLISPTTLYCVTRGKVINKCFLHRYFSADILVS